MSHSMNAAVILVIIHQPYHQTIINAIRKHDPHSLIICLTPNWSQDVDFGLNDPL